MQDLNEIYEAAVEQYGPEAAERAAEASIAAWNVNALAGFSPEVCAANLLRIVRGEVAYDRVRGVDGTLIDKPNATDEAVADAEWVLETFEPRVESDSIASDPAAAFSGDFGMIVNIIQRKEDEDA